MAWIETHKFTVAVLVMVLIWGSLISYFIYYGYSVNKNPCTLCAERLGDDIRCSTQTTDISSITFYENGSVKTDYPNTRRGLSQFPIQLGINEVKHTLEKLERRLKLGAMEMKEVINNEN